MDCFTIDRNGISRGILLDDDAVITLGGLTVPPSLQLPTWHAGGYLETAHLHCESGGVRWGTDPARLEDEEDGAIIKITTRGDQGRSARGPEEYITHRVEGEGVWLGSHVDPPFRKTPWVEAIAIVHPGGEGISIRGDWAPEGARIQLRDELSWCEASAFHQAIKAGRQAG